MNRLSMAATSGLAAATLLTTPVAYAITTGSGASAPSHAVAKPALTAKASVSSIAAWKQFRVYGTSRNTKAGTRVTLQQLHGRKWGSLPVSMNTLHDHSYNLRVKLGIRGRNQLRIVGGGGATSNVVVVTVR